MPSRYLALAGKPVTFTGFNQHLLALVVVEEKMAGGRCAAADVVLGSDCNKCCHSRWADTGGHSAAHPQTAWTSGV